MNRLLAGTAKAVITPPVGYRMDAWVLRKGRSTGIHDDLYAKALVLDSGDAAVAIITMDILGIDARIVAEARSAIHQLTGIAPDHVLFSAAHNHTSPIQPDDPEYAKYWSLFPDVIAGCVFAACNRRKEASIGHGMTTADGITINRTHREDPVDTQVGIIRIDGADHQPVACLVNYQVHTSIAGGQYLEWSADWPGYLARYIEARYPGALCYYLQGACGNINAWDWWFGNENSRHPSTYAKAKEFAERLGAIVNETFSTISTVPHAALTAASTSIILPTREVPWSVAEIAAVLEKTLQSNKTSDMEAWPEGETTATSAHHFPDEYRIIFAQRALRLVTQAKECPAEVQVMKINDLLLAANPTEFFNELGRRIKEVDPGHVFVVAYSNGYMGYVPTRAVVEECNSMTLEDCIDPLKNRWAYGAAWPTSWYAAEAGERIVETTKRLIRQLA